MTIGILYHTYIHQQLTINRYYLQNIFYEHTRSHTSRSYISHTFWHLDGGKSLAVCGREPPARWVLARTLPAAALGAFGTFLHEADVVGVFSEFGVARHIVHVLALVAAHPALLLQLIELGRGPVYGAAQASALSLSLAVPRLAHGRRTRVMHQPLPFALRRCPVPEVNDTRLGVDLHVRVRAPALRYLVECHVKFPLHALQLLFVIRRSPSLFFHEVEHVLLIPVNDEREWQQVRSIEY